MMTINFFGFPRAARAVIERSARSTLAEHRKIARAAVTRGEINFILVSDKEIRRLNRKFRGVKRITDVISFKNEGDGKKPAASLWGDIVISKGRSARQAGAAGHSWEKELSYLAIHGVLHLFGYSDYVPAKRKKMFSVQDKIFQCIFS